MLPGGNMLFPVRKGSYRTFPKNVIYTRMILNNEMKKTSFFVHQKMDIPPYPHQSHFPFWNIL